MRTRALLGLLALVALVAPAGAVAGGQPDIAALQVALQARGLYRGPVDGWLGPKTRDAVRALQRRRGLRVDGIPGSQTRAALGPYGRYVLGSRFLHPGATGWDVAELQFILASHGVVRLRPTGHYGAQTASGVRHYQQRIGIMVDGVAGPATFAALKIEPALSGIRSFAGSGGSRTAPSTAASNDQHPARTANTPARRYLRRPLVLVLGTHTWSATPSDFGARVRVGPARRAHPSASPRMRATVIVDRRRVRAYVAQLARIFDRAPVDARLLGLRRLRPAIAPEHSGLRIQQRAAVAVIMRTWIEQKRLLLRIPYTNVDAVRTRANFGSIIVVRRGSHRLYLYSGTKLSRVFQVGTGRRRHPTPIGRFVIVSRERDPWWYPPSGRWAAHLSPTPPGPVNPLGTRWIGLSAGEVGIHGTPDAASIGYSRSHGCIHMRAGEAEWLFERVRVGTPVIIVRA